MITHADIVRARKIGEAQGQLIRLGVPKELLQPITDYVQAEAMRKEAEQNKSTRANQ